MDVTSPSSRPPADDVEVFLVSPVACRLAGLPLSCVSDVARPGLPGEGGEETDPRLEAERLALWSLMDDERFVACMATMNPLALRVFKSAHGKGMGTSRRNSKARGNERILYRFASRFASRNDTTGRAGSTFWGRFGEGGTAPPLTVTGLTRAVRRRLVYASPAHAAYLDQALRRRLAPGSCKPVLAARLRWRGDGLVDAVTGVAHTPEPGDAALLRSCDGTRTVAEIAAGDEALAGRLGELAEEGLVELHSAPPPHVPLDRLLSEVVRGLENHPEIRADARAGWILEGLLDLERRLRRCPVEDFPELMARADELVGELAPYRPVDPGATLEILVTESLRDPGCRAGLVLQRSRRYEAADGTLRHRSTGAERPLDAVEARLLDAFETGSTVREALDGLPDDTDGALGAVVRLTREGVLRVDGADPADHPGRAAADIAWDAWNRGLFDATVEALSTMALPDPWASVPRLLASCRAVEQRCEDSAFPRLNPLLTPERVRGTMRELGAQPVDAAKDRAFFIVDSALPDVAFRVAGPLRDGLKRDLRHLFVLLGARAWEWEATELLPRLRGEIAPGGSLPLPVVLDRVLRWARRWRGPFLGEARPRLRAHHDPEADVVRIEGVEWPPGFDAWMEDKRIVSTVDLMVAGHLHDIREGRWRCVLNELHATGDGLPETMHATWTTLTDAPGTGFRDSHAERLLGPDVLVLQPNLPTKQAHSIAWQLRGTTLAVRNEGAGTAWSGPTVRIGDLDLVREGDGFTVRSPERPYSLLTASFATGPYRVATFSPRTGSERLAELAGVTVEPGPTGVTRTPAIELGDLRIGRRSWRLPPAAVRPRLTGGSPAELLSGAAELREELELPRFVFASLVHEKPFLCDLECIVSLEVLAHALRQDDRGLTLVEMDPSPDELWLELEGGRVTSEWRFVATAEGPGFSGGPPVLR